MCRKSEKEENEEITNKRSKKRGAKTGHIGYGRKTPKNLPEVEEIIEIPANKRFFVKYVESQ